MSARLSGNWRAQRERGGRRPLRFGVWLALHLSRGLGRMVALPVSLYFLCAAPLARRSSRAYLSLVLGRPARWREVFFHLFTFATTLLDRVLLIGGRRDELHIEVGNEEVLRDALKPGRGCLLMGSHLGSFELLGVIGSVEQKFPINVVMHVDQHAHLRDLMFRAGKVTPYNVIPMGNPGSMLRVRECLDRGEVVGILADRVYGEETTHSLPFLGRPARFSLSPWRLARITGAPVVMAFGLFQGGSRYVIRFEEIIAPLNAARPRGSEEEGLSLYVEQLERHARQYPYNWFNFYDYWGA